MPVTAAWCFARRPLGAIPSPCAQRAGVGGNGPGHPLVAERGLEGAWRICSYGEAVAAANGIGQALLDRGLGPEWPLLILSGNGVDHC